MIKLRKFSDYYEIFIIFSIFYTSWYFAAQNIYDEELKEYDHILIFIEHFIIFMYTLEYVIRVIFSKNRKKYITGVDGIVDILAVLPSLISLLVPLIPGSEWVRVLRLLRLSKIVKIWRYRSLMGGVVSRTLPIVLFCFAAKAIFISAEAQSWWTTPTNLNIALGVVGFGVAALLGAKLSTVNARIYAIEDAVCRLVGSMRDMWSVQDVNRDLLIWSIQLEKFITSAKAEKLTMAPPMRDQTDKLERTLEKNSIGGPNSAGFHRDAAFLIHRATSSTPEAYDKFLKIVVYTYLLMILVIVPGLSGLLAALMSSLVLGGMLVLVEDMDDPLNFGELSDIDARIDALTYWNQTKSEEIRDYL